MVNVCSNLTLVATSPNVGSELEQARPQTSGEEELQLQLALAMSREAAEQVHTHTLSLSISAGRLLCKRSIETVYNH